MSSETAEAEDRIDPEKDQETMRVRLWESLTDSEKEEALVAFWEASDSNTKDRRKVLIGLLASALHYRPVFVERSTALRKAGYLKKVISRRPFRMYLDDFIRAWLVEKRRPLLKACLEGVGLPNEDGYLSTEEVATEERFEAGIAAVSGKFPARDVAVYLAYLVYFGGNDETWGNIAKTEGFGILLREIGSKDSSREKVPEEGNPSIDASEPETEGFTTLDSLLITRMVASAFGEEGALGEDGMEDLVEEIVELNASRHRSLFHRGFFHALFERPFSFHFSGENAERRQWYLCGVIHGLLRRGEVDQCVEIVAVAERELGLDLAASKTCSGAALVLPHLGIPLLKAGHVNLAIRFVANQIPLLKIRSQRCHVVHAFINHASGILREGKAAEAEPVFDAMGEVLESAPADGFVPGFVASVRPWLKRRKAQCLQAKGAFEAAKSILTELDFKDANVWSDKALADLGLIEGGFRSLAAVLPRSTKEQNDPLSEGLRRGLASFEMAINVGRGKATNAHFCLGILSILEGHDRAQESADRFQSALGGMLEEAEAYTTNGILEWTRFLLALSLLDTGQPSNYLPAADLIPGVIGTQVRFPAFLWERMFEAAVLHDDSSLAIQIAEHLFSKREDTIECLLENASSLAGREQLFAAVVDRLFAHRSPVKKRWQHLVKLLRPALAHQAIEVAGTILDEMECLAIAHQEFRGDFTELLGDSDNYSPAWEAADAREARTNLMEMDNRKAEAAQLLREGFFQARSNGGPHFPVAAHGFIERIQSLGLEDSPHQELANLLRSEPDDTPPEKELRGRVLYIGGNETQMGYRERLESELASEHPALTITLYFPGWGSNWNVHLEKLKQMIDGADVVVLNSLVRTHLGRHIRDYSDAEHPWLPCTGRGYNSLKRSIVHAAGWVAIRRP